MIDHSITMEEPHGKLYEYQRQKLSSIKITGKRKGGDILTLLLMEIRNMS